jgi:hypothetical protein
MFARYVKAKTESRTNFGPLKKGDNATVTENKLSGKQAKTDVRKHSFAF